MNTWVIILSIIISVPCIQVRQVEDSLKNNLSQFQLPEDTEEKPWIWGYIKETQRNAIPGQLPTTTTTTTAMPVSDTGDMCRIVHYPTPDFTQAGRRLSTVKCYEYLWKMNVRQLEAKRREQCYRIVNGHTTKQGEFPLMGAIGWKAVNGTWLFKCGSSLISPRFVLTAAHCSLYPGDETVADEKPKIVRLGNKNILSSNVYSSVTYDGDIKKIIVHPQYASPKQYHDIALMELYRPVKFNNYIQPGCLWTSTDNSFGLKVNATGWGVLDIASTTMSSRLQVAELDIIETKTCDRRLLSMYNRNWCGNQDHQLCATGTMNAADACQGDSGGPLLVKMPLPPTVEGNRYYIIGVTSFGYGCGMPNLPGVYTRVSSFLDWIESIVWKE